MWKDFSILSQTDSSTTWLFDVQVQLERVKMCEKATHTAKGRWRTLDTDFPLSSLPSWLAGGAQHHLPLLFSAGSSSRAAGTSRAGSQALPCSAHLYTSPELRQPMNCLKSSQPFIMFILFSIPCTMFDFKNFLHHLKFNLWVFN